mgnify:FL=1
MSKIPVELPARGVVKVLGRSIPVLDSGTVGEVIELEQLLATPPTSGLRQNLEALAILIRHRLGEAVTADDLLGAPRGDLAEFEEAVNTLLAPFTKAFLAATMRRRERMLIAAAEAMAKLETRLTGEPSKPLS